jgi:hypothetical protein
MHGIIISVVQVFEIFNHGNTIKLLKIEKMFCSFKKKNAL